MANETTVHIKKIHILVTEIFQIFNDLFPPIMGEISEKENIQSPSKTEHY